MTTIGLDLGTTTVSAVKWTDGNMARSVTLKNDAALPGAAWERLQNPTRLLALARQALEELGPADEVGLTGQMHGMLYLDAAGRPLSSLRTWQDGRGNLPHPEGGTWARAFSRRTGYPAATGYGLVTWFYDRHNGLVPEGTACLCTIMDYVAMALEGGHRPAIHPTNAASLGCFDLRRGAFDHRALEALGLDPRLLPEVQEDWRAIGDNQASFLGACGGQPDRPLVNVGTGSQISLFTREYRAVPGLETRPFPGGGWLLVGAALSGGRSWALWERFLCQCAAAVTGTLPAGAYEALAALPEPTGDLPQFSPLFEGTREEPHLRAAITGLTPENFTPQHLTRALLDGMAGELAALYRRCIASGVQPPAGLLGAGNGLRKNPRLVRAVEEAFALPLTLAPAVEEAALGAALWAEKGRDR